MTTSPASFDNSLVRDVTDALASIRTRILSTGRRLEDVRILAVTKTFSLAHVAAIRAAGLDHVGENYVQEMVTKRSEWDALSSPTLTWHFLGALQTNKIADVAQYADVAASVSRVKEIDVFARQERRIPLLLQIDFTGRGERNGAPLDGVEALLSAAQRHGLDVRGLMTVADPDHAAARRQFRALRRACDDLRLAECSMGMSDDLEIACDEGTTEIRVGRALFGARKPGAAR